MKTSEVISILMKSIDKEIEIVIDNQFTNFRLEPYVRGFHVYQTGWSPIFGEENLECRHEEKNEEDEFAIGERKEIKQRCWIWLGNTCNLHV